MKTLNIIIAFTFLSTISFGQTNDSLPNDTSYNLAKNINFISFGTFCFSCSTEKVILYYYDISSVDKSLFIDKTANYFMTKDKSSLSTKIKDSVKIELAISIIKNIPKRFFQADKLQQKFGCPDCFDQGGFFIEIGQSKKTKIIYIDSQYENLETDIKKFADFFYKTFRELRK